MVVQVPLGLHGALFSLPLMGFSFFAGSLSGWGRWGGALTLWSFSDRAHYLKRRCFFTALSIILSYAHACTASFYFQGLGCDPDLHMSGMRIATWEHVCVDAAPIKMHAIGLVGRHSHYVSCHASRAVGFILIRICFTSHPERLLRGGLEACRNDTEIDPNDVAIALLPNKQPWVLGKGAFGRVRPPLGF